MPGLDRLSQTLSFAVGCLKAYLLQEVVSNLTFACLRYVIRSKPGWCTWCPSAFEKYVAYVAQLRPLVMKMSENFWSNSSSSLCCVGEAKGSIWKSFQFSGFAV